MNAEQLHDDVLKNGTPYTLEGGIQVRRGRVARQNVIQMIAPNDNVARTLRNLGVVHEGGVQPIDYVPRNYDLDAGKRSTSGF